jgi:hypothetical protein
VISYANTALVIPGLGTSWVQLQYRVASGEGDWRSGRHSGRRGLDEDRLYLCSCSHSLAVQKPTVCGEAALDSVAQIEQEREDWASSGDAMRRLRIAYKGTAVAQPSKALRACCLVRLREDSQELLPNQRFTDYVAVVTTVRALAEVAHRNSAHVHVGCEHAWTRPGSGSRRPRAQQTAPGQPEPRHHSHRPPHWP